MLEERLYADGCVVGVQHFEERIGFEVETLREGDVESSIDESLGEPDGLCGTRREGRGQVECLGLHCIGVDDFIDESDGESFRSSYWRPDQMRRFA